jgi:glycosyltransferase involved in cell wall biosynthesis
VSRTVLCVHLLNDLSGSPRVLAHVIAALRRAGVKVDLCTSASSSPGMLDDLDVTYRLLPYTRSSSRVGTLARYLYWQCRVFALVLGYWRRDAIIYVNTLLPFGAGLAGWLTRKKVVYHLHESSIRPRALKAFLTRVERWCSSRQVYVSRWLRETEGRGRDTEACVPNALSPELERAAAGFERLPRGARPFRVVMLCSLKDYKGIPEFVEVARALSHRSDLAFELVLNATRGEIGEYLGRLSVPGNVMASGPATDVRPCYERADLVLNLSRPEEWVETFGLTLLEAMAYGIPVIGPPVGGPTELVEDGVSGFLIAGRETGRIASAIVTLADGPERYAAMSAQARARARRFSRESFERSIVDVVLA